jgi:hypothetical protein
VQWEGWEYTVLHRELGAHRDPDRNMFVTVIEFESQAVMIGALGLTVSLISYPLIFVRKVRQAAAALFARLLRAYVQQQQTPPSWVLASPGWPRAHGCPPPPLAAPQAFLDDTIQQLRHNPDFKGILN